MLDKPSQGNRELARATFRVALFKRRGLAELTATDLAARLADRDADRDDRRMCLECSHLQTSGGCFAAAQGWLPATSKKHHPVQNLLQRCERFTWVKP